MCELDQNAKNEILKEIRQLRQKFEEDLRNKRFSSDIPERSFADQFEQIVPPLTFLIVVLSILILFIGDVYNKHQLNKLIIEKNCSQFLNKMHEIREMKEKK